MPQQPPGRWLCCEWCSQIFERSRADRVQGCCSRSCARSLEAEGRKPTQAEKIEALMRAIRVEVEKLMR